MEYGQITVTEQFDVSQKHWMGSSPIFGGGTDCLVIFSSVRVGTCFCLSECMQAGYVKVT